MALSSGIQQFSDGFGSTAFTNISADGKDAGGNLSFAAGLFGCAQILAPSQFGMRITGIQGSVDSGPGYPRGIRLAIISIGGQPNNATGLLAQPPFNGDVAPFDGVPTFLGGMLAGVSLEGAVLAGTGGGTGLYVPDLAIILRAGTATLVKRNGVLVHYDEHTPPSPTGGGAGRLSAFFGDGRAGIIIPPNRTAIALFIALRSYASGAALAAGTLNTASSVTGQVQGYQLTAADVGDTGRPQGRTPARFVNVGAPGELQP